MGRRKLLVSLPDEHKLVLLDAQSLLDRSPGEFQQCTVEQTFPLTRMPENVGEPLLPNDLKPDPSVDPGLCQKTTYPPPLSTVPTPAGFAQSTDRLYVADHTLPLIHVLDLSNPCAGSASERDPLVAESYAAPNMARRITLGRGASRRPESSRRITLGRGTSRRPESMRRIALQPVVHE